MQAVAMLTVCVCCAACDVISDYDETSGMWLSERERILERAKRRDWSLRVTCLSYLSLSFFFSVSVDIFLFSERERILERAKRRDWSLRVRFLIFLSDFRVFFSFLGEGEDPREGQAPRLEPQGQQQLSRFPSLSPYLPISPLSVCVPNCRVTIATTGRSFAQKPASIDLVRHSSGRV
jgi:hypothetical protein